MTCPTTGLYVQVEDPHSAVLHESHGKTDGQFAFTTKSAGEYKACFTVKGAFGLVLLSTCDIDGLQAACYTQISRQHTRQS